jgi:cytochrome-b5 reductase
MRFSHTAEKEKINNMASASRFIIKQASVPNVLLGIAAAGGIYTAYSYMQSSTPSRPRKVFGGLAGSLTLQQTEDINHNTKRLRFAFPNAHDETGLTVVCVYCNHENPMICYSAMCP